MIDTGVEEKLREQKNYTLNQELFEFCPKEKKALISSKYKKNSRFLFFFFNIVYYCGTH